MEGYCQVLVLSLVSEENMLFVGRILAIVFVLGSCLSIINCDDFDDFFSSEEVTTKGKN